MKGFLLGAILALLPAAATAQINPQLPPFQTTGVASQYRSTFTCFGVSIASYSAVTTTNTVTPIFPSTTTTAVSMVSGSTVSISFTLNPYRDVNFQNLSTANIYLSDSISVSTFSAAQGKFVGGAGWLVGKSSGTWTTPLVPGQQLYGTNDSTTGTAYLTVCPGN